MEEVYELCSEVCRLHVVVGESHCEGQAVGEEFC